jgi:hypothetical protein
VQEDFYASVEHFGSIRPVRYPNPTHAVILVVDQTLHADSHASFVYAGVPYAANQSVNGTLSASSQALAGTTSTPELRTAARVSEQDITANARLDDKLRFSNVDFLDNSSIAIFTVVLHQIAANAENVSASIYFPSSYVEVSSFVELRNATLTPAIFATISMRSCSTATQCFEASEDIFEFQSYMDGSYNSFSYLDHAESQPGVDVTPLQNP